jgi:hypothetical protein
MSAKSKAIRLEGHRRPRRHARSQVANQSEQRADEDAVRIGALYRKGQEAIRESIKYHLQAGRKLIQKKQSMPHGGWVRWLRANAYALGFRHRTTASRLMKAAAGNDALTHPLREVEAIRINRRLWGNLAAVTTPKGQFNEIVRQTKAPLAKFAPIDIADECIATVRTTIERAIIGLRKANAPSTKFELLFEALAEIVVDVQRRMATDQH